MSASPRQKTSAAIFGLAVVVLAYQNCGEPFKAGDFSSKILPSGVVDARGRETPTPSTSPVDTKPEIANWDAAFPKLVKANDCMTNPEYNLCLPWRDPLTTYGQRFTPGYTVASATDAQDSAVLIYGMKVPTTAIGNQNYTIDVSGTTITKVAAANNSWKYNVKGDTSRKVAQLSMFYVVNYQRTYMTERTGTFYYARARAGATLRLKPYIATFQGQPFENAMFSQTDGSLTFGFWRQGSDTADFSLDGSVIAHEAGHGNFHYALPAASRLALDPNLKRQNGQVIPYCLTINGCFSAMHEGIADIHSFILYPEAPPSIAPYVMNNAEGFDMRDPAANLEANVTSTSLYNGSGGGEIHYMGSAYAMIWYQVWKKAKDAGAEKDIEKIFSEHLADLSPSDTFITAFDVIETNANALVPAKSAMILTDFRAAYTKVGLTLP